MKEPISIQTVMEIMFKVMIIAYCDGARAADGGETTIIPATPELLIKAHEYALAKTLKFTEADGNEEPGKE